MSKKRPQVPAIVTVSLSTFSELLKHGEVWFTNPHASEDVATINRAIDALESEAGKTYTHYHRNYPQLFPYPAEPKVTGDLLKDEDLYRLVWRCVRSLRFPLGAANEKKQTGEIVASFPPEAWRIRLRQDMAVLRALAETEKDVSEQEADDLTRYFPAWKLKEQLGISATTLSRYAKKKKVRTRKVPPGIDMKTPPTAKNPEGGKIKILYNIDDAKKHYKR